MIQDASRAQTQWDDFFLYNPASRHRRRILFGLISRFAPQVRHALDVGCGDGRFLEELQGFFNCRLSGIEIGVSSAPRRLRGRLERLYRIDIQEAAVEGPFDLVACSEVLEHLPRHEAAARHLAAMCRGLLLVTVPARMRETDKPMGHLRAYTEQSLKSLLEGAGFETLACFRWGFPFHQLYRSLLDILPGAAMTGFGKSRYGLSQRLLCLLLYALFYLSVPGLGEQLFYAGRKRASVTS